MKKFNREDVEAWSSTADELSSLASSLVDLCTLGDLGVFSLPQPVRVMLEQMVSDSHETIRKWKGMPQVPEMLEEMCRTLSSQLHLSDIDPDVQRSGLES